jgi:putative membrane protein
MRGAYVVFGVARKPTPMERLVAFGIRWALLSVAVWVAANVVDGIYLDGWESTLIVALILGLLNAVVRPVLFWLSLPLTCLTVGFFLLVLNAAMLALTAWIAGHFDRIHFRIDGFWDAFWGALIISVVAWLLGLFVRTPRRG